MSNNTKITDSILDEMLSHPVKTLPDDGFTDKIVQRILSKRRQNRFIIGVCVFLASLGCIGFFPTDILAKFVEDPMASNSASLLTILIAVLTPIISLLVVVDK